MRFSKLTGILLGLSACTAVGLLHPAPAAARHVSGKAKAPAGATALIAQGKALAEKDKCNTCHGADYTGKPKFSPSLRANGILRKYNAKTWARVMKTGVTEDGGKVKPPMPIYKMSAKDSAALYAYFKTLK